jgi:hypothetical protein
MNALTNVIAWFLKNVNMIIGVIGSLAKVAVAIINIFQPDKDSLVDTIQEWSEKIQAWIYKGQSFLSAFGK